MCRRAAGSPRPRAQRAATLLRACRRPGAATAVRDSGQGTAAQAPRLAQAQHTSVAALPRGCRNEASNDLGSRTLH
ncbi:hypothetical protein NDU88_002117 [Pleurodeles waltl]|uniref:Uncharacterized protein n=1 Tax=Pleurodeles waltl TaxID=8319 RepID=A0AAV7U919_PLEWA|nr:hypothetical protein NDU88_002117 [Pleurodeles waltl]